MILHVMGMDSSKYGGIERFNVELSKTLRKKGYKGVFVYESSPANRDFVEDIEREDCEIIVVNSRKNKLNFCIGLLKVLIEYRPLLVHAHFTKARFYAVPISRFWGIRRLFITIHSQIGPKNEIKFFTRCWYRWVNRVARIIAVSDNLAMEYKTNWPDADVKRIYLGVKQMHENREDSRRALEIPQEQMMLLTIANYNYIKGLDVLCEAIEILMTNGELSGNVCFYIVGQPDIDKEELGVLISSLKIHKYIKMIGISNEIHTYLSAADIYIQPSRSEGIGLALMEAASASLPLIGTRVGGIPEVIKEGFNGVLVESEDCATLANSITCLMRDNGLRKRYGENSLKVYHDAFSVEEGVSQTVKYYGI